MEQHIMEYKRLLSSEFQRLLPDQNQQFSIIHFHQEVHYQVLDLYEPYLKLYKKVLILFM